MKGIFGEVIAFIADEVGVVTKNTFFGRLGTSLFNAETDAKLKKLNSVVCTSTRNEWNER